MNSRIFTPSIRPPKAPRHEAGSTPRHLIPCRYFARGYCSRGDSCMFSHSFYDPIQYRGLQGNHHTFVPFWNNGTVFSPQPYAERYHGVRRPSLSPQLIIGPPPSPSSSSVTTPGEASPLINPYLPGDSTPVPLTIVADIIPNNSASKIPTRASTVTSGDASCDESSTTRSDVVRDGFSSPSMDIHSAEFHPLPSHSPTYSTPVPYVQRGFGYRDNRARGRDNRRRRMKVTFISSVKTNIQMETPGSPSTAVLQGTATRRSGTTSDSDNASVKPHQEAWRVIGGGVMLGTATNATSRRKLKRLQSRPRVTEEGHLNGSYDESLESNRPTDESLEFSNLVASIKLTINRPPLPDIIERPKSSLPLTKGSPLAAFFAHAEVA